MSTWRFRLRHPIQSLDIWWAVTADCRRLDHAPANACMIVGLMLSTMSILLQGPSPNSTLEGMTPDLQMFMCLCIFVGLGIKLHGALAHTRFFRRNMPLRKCYEYGYRGAPLASSGLFVYSWYIISNTVGWLSALGSVLVGFLGFGILLQGMAYWLESRRLETLEHQLILSAQQTKADDAQ